eukprot:TRINITY_DN9180_c0_g2_i3.p1 TRINITY_DN9180_c0_g2~~TRINITY_DN9180_c0_g2_i3.p1  ORF type:complete len:449 (-),score=135.74 TRINITY_DN9180_c0_g2_i3:261-1607(-)
MQTRSISAAVRLLNKFRRNFAAAQNAKPGSLYTWGDHPAGLGWKIKNPDDLLSHDVPNAEKPFGIPQRVDHFDNNVAKVAMGPYHTAVITTDGKLYTFGYGKRGALGHGDSENRNEPRQVEHFANSRTRVVDVAVGQYHTVALTENGEVYSWGWAGSGNVFIDMISDRRNALGIATDSNILTPTPIESLRNAGKFVSVAAGRDFALAINNDGDLYSWGRGTEGQNGDGDAATHRFPTLNNQIRRLRDKKHIKIVSVKSAGNYTWALMSDGAVYGWGLNDQGQVGFKENVGLLHDTQILAPHKIDTTLLGDKKIVSFDVAENTSVIQTDSNELFWSGLNLAYKPWPFALPKGSQIKSVGACHNSVAAVTQDNRIYMYNEFVQPKALEYNAPAWYADNSYFNGGEILSVGGSYRNRYAVIKHQKTALSNTDRRGKKGDASLRYCIKILMY